MPTSSISTEVSPAKFSRLRVTILTPRAPASAGPDIAAQVRYAVEHEWARSEDDVLRRRTTLFYRGLADETTAARVATLLSG